MSCAAVPATCWALLGRCGSGRHLWAGEKPGKTQGFWRERRVRPQGERCASFGSGVRAPSTAGFQAGVRGDPEGLLLACIQRSSPNFLQLLPRSCHPLSHSVS